MALFYPQKHHGFFHHPERPPEAPTIRGSTAQHKAIKVQDVRTRHDLKLLFTTACLNNWEIRCIYIYVLIYIYIYIYIYSNIYICIHINNINSNIYIY